MAAASSTILLAIVLHTGVIAIETLEANLNLVYVSTRSDGCEGPQPIVQLSARSRERDANQPFSGWNLIAHYTGNCSYDQNVVFNSNNTFSQYQFRVELSQGASCQCVTLANISHSLGVVQQEWNNGTFWCGEEQPLGPLLCASEHNSRLFVSRVVQIKDQQPPSTLTCDKVKFSTTNTKNLAVAYKNTFFGTCPSNNTCFPGKVVEQIKDARVSISFSLVFNNQQPAAAAGNYSNVSYANDGVLLGAVSPNSFQALKFFYNSNNTRTGLVPLVQFMSNKRVKLTYDDGNTTVSRRFIGSEFKVFKVLLKNSELASNRARFQWKQVIQNSSLHCKEWSLSNISISLDHDRCTRNILSNYFKPSLWSLHNSTSTCNGSNCLHLTSTIEQQNVVRTASTDQLDLATVTGLLPPPAPAFVPEQKMTCTSGLTLLVVEFELTVRSFRYPTPCTDLLPHGINMTVSDVPLAYFAPIANTRWPAFNATSMSFTNSDGSKCPVYHPRQNGITVMSACVNITGKEFMSIAWEQEHFKFANPKDDLWYMNVEQVSLGEITFSDFNRTKQSQNYTLKVDKERTDRPLPSCFPPNITIIHLTNPFPSFPRKVNLTLNLTSFPIQPTTEPTNSPTPLSLSCPPVGRWPATLACSLVNNSKLSDTCSSHSSATRLCRCNGTWEDEMCLTAFERDLDLIDESPKAGLARLMTLSIEHINGSQWFYAFERAIAVQLNRTIDEEFVKTAVEFIDRLLNSSVDVPGVELLILLDRLALNINFNTTYFLKNIGLRVRQVYPNSGDIMAIQYENNYITLPQEIFKKPVFVGSFYFRNISHLLQGAAPISPVMSSVIRCSDCATSNLREKVKIQLSMAADDTQQQCVFANLKLGISRDDFWNNTGCNRVLSENGSVLCECNHLTHFAIILSPGVEIPVKHQFALTTIGQVLVSISLVFLLITILAFIVFKSLWSMRNYIHVMLCANLFIAQLLFVAGVGQTENSTVCSIIAVVLHYAFLVVFMWMLMEGVVLYVVLVRVFIKHHARYIAGFTIASYGIPLVYIAIVAPIGFLVNTDSNGHHYSQYNSGNRTACWLRDDTHFVWAMIAPVILIILINCGFLIMALVITYRHYRRQDMKGKVNEAKHWIKVIISLMIVMGIVWIGNLLFFHTSLIAVAYIMTIFIAGQGIIIFVLFVPMSKQVRDTYMKWWKVKRMQSSFLSKVFPSKISSSLPPPTNTKKLLRSKTALANYYNQKNAFDDENLDDKHGDVHLSYLGDQPDSKKSDEKEFDLPDEKRTASKRKVMRRATVTNVYGKHVMEIYKKCGTTESCSDDSKQSVEDL